MQTASATASTGASASSSGSMSFSRMATDSPARTVIRRSATIHRTRSWRRRGALGGMPSKQALRQRRERAGRPDVLENTSPLGRRMPWRSPGGGTGRVTGGTREGLGRPSRQPAGQPAELLASVPPEEAARLAGAPEAGRLADQPRRRIAHHGFAQERELVDQRRRLRALEEGRRRRLAGG